MFSKRLNYRYYLLLVSAYAVLLFIAIGGIFMQTDRIYKQLDFYEAGNYQYFYEVTSSTHENDYLQCSSVYFYADRNMKESLLGDCLMMLEKSTYNSVAPIRPSNQLENREIAVTANLAKQFDLKVGSKVFSKHNINNSIEEYTVAEILPVAYGVLRVDYSINYGIIVMGCDSEYLNNTNYSFIGFSEKDPTALIQGSRAGLLSLNIKEPYEQRLLEKAFVCQSGICVMVISVTVLYAMIHWKNQMKYYNRLKLNGCAVNEIKRQIVLDIGMPGILGLLISFLLSVTVLSFYNLYISWLMPLISVTIGGCTLLISIWLILQKDKRS